MTIKEADAVIDSKLAYGLIGYEEAARMRRMIRRTGDYGNQWSWDMQKPMRAIVVG